MKKFALILPWLLFVTFHAFAQGASLDGEALAKQILNNDVVPATSSTSGSKTMSGLGINSQTVGGPSSDQVNDMGVAGTAVGSLVFMVKPACSFSNQTVWGASGAHLIIACQSALRGAIAAKLCLANSNSSSSCNQSTEFNLPLNEKAVMVDGFQIKATCGPDGRCSGTMTGNEKTVTGNSNDMLQEAQKVKENSAAYSTIFKLYASKQGYNRTQAYMRSFQNNGANNWLSKCVGGMKGYVQGGVYYSCNGVQQGDIYNSCKVTKSCIKYAYQKTTQTIKKQCTLSASDQHISCYKAPQVKIVQEPYQEDDRYHGSLHMVDAHHFTFIAPESGTITNISIGFNYPPGDAGWLCHAEYQGYINGKYLGVQPSIGCGHWRSGINFNNNDLDLKVSKGETMTFSYDGYVEGAGYIWDHNYSYTISSTQYRPVAQVSMVQNCPTSTAVQVS